MVPIENRIWFASLCSRSIAIYWVQKIACEVQTKRLGTHTTVKARIKQSTKYFDLAVALYWVDNSDDFMTQLYYDIADVFKERMTEKGLSEDDLPKDCFSGI